jgi:hypothetical protein
VKRCLHCGITKPLSEFYGDRKARDGRRPECKACNLSRRKAAYAANPGPARERAKRWAADNPERYAERIKAYKDSGRKAIADRKSHLKRKYGITLEQYDAMLAAQGGVCAICSEKPGDLTLHVDHDHTTGAVRSLLCIRCNNALGLFQESQFLFQAAADYLGRREDDAASAALVHERVRELARSN